MTEIFAVIVFFLPEGPHGTLLCPRRSSPQEIFREAVAASGVQPTGTCFPEKLEGPLRTLAGAVSLQSPELASVYKAKMKVCRACEEK